MTLSDGDPNSPADHLPNVRNILVHLEYSDANQMKEQRYHSVLNQGKNNMISMLNRWTHEQKRVTNKSSICVLSSRYTYLSLESLLDQLPLSVIWIDHYDGSPPMAYELNGRWMPVATRTFLVQEIGKAG